jgi:hypothetical protein
MSGRDVALEYLQSATMKITVTLEARRFETLPFDADFRSYQSSSFSNDHKMSFQLFFNLSVSFVFFPNLNNPLFPLIRSLNLVQPLLNCILNLLVSDLHGRSIGGTRSTKVGAMGSVDHIDHFNPRKGRRYRDAHG